MPSETDMMIVAATALVALGIPFLLSAWVERRVGLIGLLCVAGGAALGYMAWAEGALATWRDVPDAFVRTAGALLN